MRRVEGSLLKGSNQRAGVESPAFFGTVAQLAEHPALTRLIQDRCLSVSSLIINAGVMFNSLAC